MTPRWSVNGVRCVNRRLCYQFNEWGSLNLIRLLHCRLAFLCFCWILSIWVIAQTMLHEPHYAIEAKKQLYMYIIFLMHCNLNQNESYALLAIYEQMECTWNHLLMKCDASAMDALPLVNILLNWLKQQLCSRLNGLSPNEFYMKQCVNNPFHINNCNWRIWFE